MNRPLVSVIVPIYKVEAFLDRCVSSVVQQTYKNLEIILVDDGSPDRCPQICDDWAGKDSRIRVIHKENAGLGMARNTGIEHATGSYVYFLASDDYIDPETIEETVCSALEHSVEVVLFGRKWINQNSEIFRMEIPSSPKTVYRDREVWEQLLPDVIHGGSQDAQTKNLCLNACTSLFSMDLIRRCHWRFISERENISEDTHSSIWLYQHVTSAAVVEKAYNNHYQNTSSLTQTYRPDRFQKIVKSYRQTLELAQLYKNTAVIEQRISEVYLGFLIAAMKQIVAHGDTASEKFGMIGTIVQDPTTRCMVKSCGSFDKNTKNIMAWVLEKRMTAVCCALLWLQVRKDRR